MELKENSPRHEQISDWMREKILSDSFSVGDRLPSENNLVDKFGVSRVTIRHALNTLENEGLVERRQGLGSFVADFRVQQPFVCLSDFSEDMQRAGIRARSEVTRYTVEEADRMTCRKLELDKDAKVVKLERIRLGNELPIAFDITWLPIFYGQLLEDHNLEEVTLYSIFENEYNIPINRGKYQLTAANLDTKYARHLNVEPSSAALQINRLSLTTGDRKVYYQSRYYRPDRICYQLQLERGDEACERYARGLPLKEFTPLFLDNE